MCLIAFAIGASERWPLVVASNRDEFFDRPTLPLSQWQPTAGQTIASGRDLLCGGTWLGATPGGRVAWLTNVRESQSIPAPASRGELVLRWLQGRMQADDFMEQTEGASYSGFNLVLGDLATSSWTWLSNRRFDGSSALPHLPVAGWTSRALSPGIYGLSNAALDTPWPKTLALKTALTAALHSAKDEKQLAAPLWTALASQHEVSLAGPAASGLSIELERALSSAFVSIPGRGAQGYGTRCSTLLTAGQAQGRLQGPGGGPVNWTICLEERTFGGLDSRPGNIHQFEMARTAI